MLQSELSPFKVTQGHPMSSILVPIESAYIYIFLLVIDSNFIAPFQIYGGLNVENRHFALPHSYSG